MPGCIRIRVLTLRLGSESGAELGSGRNLRSVSRRDAETQRGGILSASASLRENLPGRSQMAHAEAPRRRETNGWFDSVRPPVTVDGPQSIDAASSNLTR